MIVNIIIATAMQFASWCICYAAGGARLAQSLGLIIGLLLGVGWHTAVYLHWLWNRRGKYRSPHA